MVGVETLTGSLLGGLLILAMLLAGVTYGWCGEDSAKLERAHRGTEGPPIKRAA